MKLSRRKMELMLVDIAVIICVYYMTNLVKVLRLHSIVLNGEINLARMLALVVTIMAGRIVFGVYRNIWRYANIQTYLTIMVSDFVSNVLLMLLGRVWFAVNLGIGVHLIVAMAILLVTLLAVKGIVGEDRVPQALGALAFCAAFAGGLPAGKGRLGPGGSLLNAGAFALLLILLCFGGWGEGIAVRGLILLALILLGGLLLALLDRKR